MMPMMVQPGAFNPMQPRNDQLEDAGSPAPAGGQPAPGGTSADVLDQAARKIMRLPAPASVNAPQTEVTVNVNPRHGRTVTEREHKGLLGWMHKDPPKHETRLQRVSSLDTNVAGAVGTPMESVSSAGTLSGFAP